MPKTKRDITPELAPELAQRFVEFTKSIEGIDLDYSVASLELVDGIIEGMRQDGLTANDQYLTLVVAGCYVGEVFVHHYHLKWIKAEDSSYANWSDDVPIVIEYATRRYTSPISKVIKRLENGEEDSLPWYHQVLRKLMAEQIR
jgi:hypothetical protein